TRPAAETPLKPLAAVTGSGVPSASLRGTRSDWDEWVASPAVTGEPAGLACTVLPRGTAGPGDAAGLGAIPAARLEGTGGVMRSRQGRHGRLRVRGGYFRSHRAGRARQWSPRCPARRR